MNKQGTSRPQSVPQDEKMDYVLEREEKSLMGWWESLPADIYFPFSTQYIVKATVFPIVMYRCESWTIKKAEHWRTDAFRLWYWRRLLRIPWTARRSNQSILKEVNPVYSLEGLMLKLKLQYSGHLMQRANSLEKTLTLGDIESRKRRRRQRTRWFESRKRRRWQRMRWFDGITDSMHMSWASSERWWGTGKPGVLQSLGVPGSPWDHKALDMIEWLNNNNEHFVVVYIFLTNSQ